MQTEVNATVLFAQNGTAAEWLYAWHENMESAVATTAVATKRSDRKPSVGPQLRYVGMMLLLVNGKRYVFVFCL